MSRIPLTLACGDYDRTRPLWDGSVQADGLDLNVLLLPVEDIFLRMARFQEFDASELSLSTFLITQSRGEPRFAAIPVFPSRKFRHADIYIRRGSRIRKPEDLQGGRIGLIEYQMTAAVWVRGILQEFHGVKAADVSWFTANEERLPIELPPSIRVQVIPKGQNLMEMLRKGELDAVSTARIPPAFQRGEDWIARLFPDYREVEGEYYKKTGIFPIMHTVVLREDVYRKFPWAARSLTKAFEQVKEQSLEKSLSLGAPPITQPWFFHEMDRTIALMGRNFWPYGIEANRVGLAKMLQYMREQGLVPADFQPAIEDLFAPSVRGGI